MLYTGEAAQKFYRCNKKKKNSVNKLRPFNATSTYSVDNHEYTSEPIYFWLYFEASEVLQNTTNLNLEHNGKNEFFS